MADMSAAAAPAFNITTKPHVACNRALLLRTLGLWACQPFTTLSTVFIRNRCAHLLERLQRLPVLRVLLTVYVVTLLCLTAAGSE
jgi:hypothetical protein